MEHIEYNIQNLLNLYATVGKPFNGYASDSAIGYSRIQASEWPNKIWSNEKLTPDVLQNIKILIESSKIKMRFVDFEYGGSTNHRFIEQSGFELTNSMPGMHLKLTNPFETPTRLSFKMVTEMTEAKIWTAVFKQAFGYLISEDLVLKNLNKIHFYITFEDSKPIGVVKLHRTNNIAGIYSLGVPVAFRGNGYAKEIMHFVLNKAMQQGATVATLQASKLGQGMYERMGFKNDFTVHSYKLKTQ
ncbi:GNAT family N-acetyltransferase [Bizionia paragorgiae]|uniref:GNAT family N-acetyltransferase n=1 Tax=Bizionia paragorgiae TaxID=283786 RepID=UPI003A8CD474